MMSEHIGQELREARLQRGQTQVEAGERMGVPGNTVARWERGEKAPTGHGLRAVRSYIKRTALYA